MTKFELPEKPKKTNTSEDFNNLRKAVDELDKFDYTWKTYANKADRRINAANKYIEELEQENQSLKAAYNNQAESILLMLEEISTLKSQLQQQALPVVPECVDKWYKFHMDGTFSAVITSYASDGADKPVIWLVQNGGMDLLCKMKLYGYTVEKPQLFYLREKNTNYYLNKSKNNGLELVPNPYFDEDNQFTQQEIDSMKTGSYELVPVEDGE